VRVAWLDPVGQGSGSFDTDALVAARCAGDDLNVLPGHAAKPRDEPDQRRVGLTVYRRGTETNLELVSVQTGDFIPIRAWLNAHPQNQCPVVPAIPWP
jgi:hypothetical protein